MCSRVSQAILYTCSQYSSRCSALLACHQMTVAVQGTMKCFQPPDMIVDFFCGGQECNVGSVPCPVQTEITNLSLSVANSCHFWLPEDVLLPVYDVFFFHCNASMNITTRHHMGIVARNICCLFLFGLVVTITHSAMNGWKMVPSW